jgi:FecR protein
VTIGKQRGQPPGISCHRPRWLNVVLTLFAALQRRLRSGSQAPADMLHCNYRQDEMPFALALILELTWLSPEQRKELQAFGSQKPSPSNVIDFSTYFPDRVVRRRTLPPPAPLRPRWHRTLALTTATVLMIVSPLLFWPGLSSDEYVTGIGQYTSIRLADGSSVTLNSQSRLRVRFSGRGRDLMLLEGAALFSVARDASRPFRVHTGATIVEAMGTDFSVWRANGITQIAVKRGQVKVFENPNQTPLILNPYGLIPTDTTVFEWQTQPGFSVGAGHEARIYREYGLTDMEVEMHWVTTAELERHIAWANGPLALAAHSSGSP